MSSFITGKFDSLSQFELRLLCPPQVDPSSSCLNSSDVFLLVSSSGSWMWKGKSSSSAEAQGAEHLAGLLQVTPTPLDEGEEEGEGGSPYFLFFCLFSPR